MTIYSIGGIYYGFAHSTFLEGGYVASGKTRMEVITKLLLNFYI